MYGIDLGIMYYKIFKVRQKVISILTVIGGVVITALGFVGSIFTIISEIKLKGK